MSDRIQVATLETLTEILRELRGDRRTSEGDPTRARYGVPTTEDTLRWGGVTDLSFVTPSGGGENVAAQAPQMLVHVMRHRPTAWACAFMVALGEGWTGEGTGWTMTLELEIGVGTSRQTFYRVYSLGAAPASNSAPVNDLFQIPAQAIQATCIITGGPSVVAGPHGVTAGFFAAPVVQ